MVCGSRTCNKLYVQRNQYLSKLSLHHSHPSKCVSLANHRASFKAAVIAQRESLPLHLDPRPRLQAHIASHIDGHVHSLRNPAPLLLWGVRLRPELKFREEILGRVPPIAEHYSPYRVYVRRLSNVAFQEENDSSTRKGRVV